MLSADRRSSHRPLILALVCSAQFLLILDASLVTVSLPSIGRALEIDQHRLSWVVNAYVIAFAGTLLLGGRLVDLVGRRRAFTAGMAAFGLTSLAGGLAGSAAQLFAARAAQGLAAAVAIPAALSIIAVTFPAGPARNRALGAWGAVAASGGVAGVLIGGALTTGVGWEWIFFVKLPIALAASAAALLVVAPDVPSATRRRVDVASGACMTAAIAVLVYALLESPVRGWTAPETIALLGLAGALILVFVAVERRTRTPLLPVRLLREKSAANVLGLAIGASVLATFFFISLYMAQVLGYSALRTGLAYLPLAVAALASSVLTVHLIGRAGIRATLTLGLVLSSAGLAWFSRVPVHGGFAADILGPSVLMGIGLGIAVVAATIVAIDGVDASRTGVASGLFNTSLQFGSALGLGVAATIATSRTDAVIAAAAGRPDLPAALTAGFRAAFLAAAVFALAGAILAVVMLPRRRATAMSAATAP